MRFRFSTMDLLLLGFWGVTAIFGHSLLALILFIMVLFADLMVLPIMELLGKGRDDDQDT